MIPELRRAYNAAFTADRYQGYQQALAAVLGLPVDFRLAETPVFLPPALRDELVAAALGVVAELDAPELRRSSLAAVPAEFDVPGCDDHPSFAAVDFALALDGDGRVVPRLIELQGFPSLYGFQVFQGRELRQLVPGGEKLSFCLSGLDEAGYVEAVGKTVLGGHDPADVVLFDLEPEKQKTVCDFRATEILWGVRAVCPSTVEKRGRELWYRRDGAPRRIRRIYNRVIVDELVKKGTKLPFSYREPLEVEWAPHPNWYFRWSKHALPRLKHPSAPEARVLAELDAAPADLDRWVLKPLFSFAGAGVKVEVTAADLAAIPPERRGDWLLMRKVDYAPVIETVDGNRSKCEVRVLLVWTGARPLPVTTLIRLSQGKMMGVDYNKDRTWVGSSCGLWPA